MSKRSAFVFSTLLCLCIACFQAAEAQEQDSSRFLSPAEFQWGGRNRFMLAGGTPCRATDVQVLPAAIVGGCYIGMFGLMHATMLDAWWENSSPHFKFRDDWNTTCQIDKLGHMFGGYMSSYILGEGLLVAGFSKEDATLYAALAGLAFQTYIEVEDGFAEDWGFSVGDMAANLLGISLYYAQWRIPALQDVHLKWQFVPPAWVDAQELSSTWIDEYNTVTLWFSLDMHAVLPEAARATWPRWLNLAAGYGIQQEVDVLYRRYLLALDFDLVHLLPDGPAFWNWFKQSLNYVKFPAPALEFSERGTRAYLLFPFKL